MEIRGGCECKECDCRWSYYETGSVSCPQCGSLRSIGVGGRERHTATQADLDLSVHCSVAGDGSTRDAAPALKSDLRDYVRQTGYIRGGELPPFGNTPFAAHEPLHAVDVIARSDRPTDDRQFYVISLFQRTDEGEHLAPDPVSDSMTDVRGFVYAEAIDAYCRDLSTQLDDNPNPEVRTTLETLSNHRKRVEMLDGVVLLSESEALVGAARETHTALIGNDLDALAPIRDILAALF